jgi:transposase-like protein
MENDNPALAAEMDVRLLRFDGHRLRETTESQSPMNEPVTASKKSRQKFAPAFKQQAVALWLNSNKAGSAVAAELGIKPNRLYSWRERFAPPPRGGDGGGGAKPTAEALVLENAALRREVEHLRQQRDILKKTLGILSEPPTNAFSGLMR